MQLLPGQATLYPGDRANPVQIYTSELSSTPPTLLPATAARLRGKQHLLDVLTQRVRDTSSYTRRACLAAWQGLAETRTLPLGHWAAVTDIAVGAHWVLEVGGVERTPVLVWAPEHHSLVGVSGR